MTTATATIIRLSFEARNAFEDHFDGCRACGCGGRLCAAGARLHSAYAAAKASVEGR